MTTNELIERLRSKRPIDLETLSDLLEEAADCIDGLEDRIAEKQKHIENLQKVNEDLEERIAIMSEHGLWTPVEKQLPEEGKFVLVYGELYPNEREGCKVAVSRRIDFNYWIGLGRERKVTHWMPTPEPPKEGEAE